MDVRFVHDFSAVEGLLGKAAPAIVAESVKVTGMALNNIKKDAARRVSGLPHLRHLPRSFTYDVGTFAGVVYGEVGAAHERLQGKLDWVAEYGTPTSAPIPHWRPATEKELPAWYRYLDKAAVDALDGLK